MKTRNIIFGTALLFIAGILVFTSCKKDNSPSSSSNETISQQAVQLQNSDAQDALADKTEEDIDNKLDELQNNNYAVSSAKSASIGLVDTVVINVTPADSFTFPKTITLDYYTYKDSSANETIVKNGEIIINVSLADAKHPRLITRDFKFNNFSITTDSSTVILNGTRSVKRTKNALKLKGFVWARDSVIDNITASLNYAITTTGGSDTLKFTRIVNKVRTAITYYVNVNYKAGEPLYNLTHLHYKHAPSMDSLKYTGAVTGENEKGENYTKTITDTLVIIDYKGSLVVTSGTMAYSVIGADSFSITFKQDPAHPHLTLVTATNNTTGKTKSFDRKFGGVFKKW